jgi:hypothetical protein
MVLGVVFTPLVESPVLGLAPSNIPLCTIPDPYDLARFNLEAAAGLPGVENLDIEDGLQWIKQAARKVEKETNRYRSQFNTSPESFDYSVGRFKIRVMATVLQRELGVHYRMKTLELSDRDFFGDPANLLIHGIIQGKGGICSSMPVLYAADASDSFHVTSDERWW